MPALLWELSRGTNFDLVRNKTVLFCQCLSLSLPAVSLLGAIKGSLILGLSLATGLSILSGIIWYSSLFVATFSSCAQ